ncbi:hypothetical protein JTE90_011022 [Oedothorax gibbosus]|uniref:Uncharacterized protein n=1 Tax=Oedothorax gibbosus TaxID=931172 RepID=A0AAV6VFH6_9ARAC|nr:hypothetical protein JTE90_011022 [Oedothorax gibbosus]
MEVADIEEQLILAAVLTSNVIQALSSIPAEKTYIPMPIHFNISEEEACSKILESYPDIGLRQFFKYKKASLNQRKLKKKSCRLLSEKSGHICHPIRPYQYFQNHGERSAERLRIGRNQGDPIRGRLYHLTSGPTQTFHNPANHLNFSSACHPHGFLQRDHQAS